MKILRYILFAGCFVTAIGMEKNVLNEDKRSSHHMNDARALLKYTSYVVNMPHANGSDQVYLSPLKFSTAIFDGKKDKNRRILNEQEIKMMHEHFSKSEYNLALQLFTKEKNETLEN